MLHQLGSGVLGPVFRAHDDERDRLVAVKVFRLDLTPELAEEVGDDLQALVRHWPTAMPGLVRPVRAGVEQATPWLAQEFAPGEGLDAVLRRRSRPSVDAVVGLVRLIADALDGAAADGWTHGALHPRDVLVTHDLDGIAITGVGIAHVVERAGFRAPRRRPYVAPERVAGHGWDARADLYSLAVITLELLGTRRASSGGHLPVATVLDEAGLDVEHWSRALTKALAEDPAQRFETAGAFADALEAACSTEGRAPRLPLEDPEPETFAAAAPSTFAEVAIDRPAVPSELLDEADIGPAVSASLDALGDGPLATASISADDPGVDPDIRPSAPSLLDDPLEGPAPELAVARVAPSAAVDVEEPPETRANAWQIDDASTPPVMPPGAPAPSPRPYGLLAATLLLGIFIGFLAGAWTMRGGAFAGSSAPTARADVPMARGEVSEEPVTPGDVTVPADRSGASSSQPTSGAASGAPTSSPTAAIPAPVATSSPRADATPGTLRITSAPSGARVDVDGRGRGTTPLVLRDMALGTYRIEVSRDGYQDRSTRVTLSDARKEASVALTLPRDRAARQARTATPAPARPQPATGNGSLVIATRPAGAQVFVDGRLVGTSPVTIATIAPGSHNVRLELPGHKPWATAVDVSPNQERRVSASLEPTGVR